MFKFLRRVQEQIYTPSADEVKSFDLGVNPLSHLQLGIRPLNDTGTLANFPSYLSLMDAINRLSIIWNGVTIISGSGRDLAAMNFLRWGINPAQATHIDTNNDRRCAVLPVIMGRDRMDPNCCFPATRRGELVMELDLDIADTGYDALSLTVETMELPGAKPKEFERRQSLSKTFAQTGRQDFDITFGNRIRGILLWGTTGFAGAAPAPTWGRIGIEVDGIQTGYAATDWEVLFSDTYLNGRQPFSQDAHKHRVTTDGNVQTELATLGGPYNVGSGLELYNFLDFDWNRDDFYTLDVSDAKRVVIANDCETANAARVTVCEVLPVSALMMPTT